ncbi:MAG: Atxe2 family lasso peptide isopeptidase [Sphingomonas sp.]|jgi:hypothetical protein|uniref:Atxe2 family lasso peptide isopeptidase n=1 Tax=Alphaproteobacteria TaxID=28211 RepID=UPI00352A1D22
MRNLRIALALAGLAAPIASAHATDACQDLDWRRAQQSIVKRALTAEDLVRLRDIGQAGDMEPAEHVMTLSPDERWVAFQIRQADPVANRYCLAMVVQPLDGGEARFVDEGGDFMLAPDGVPTVPATAIGTARTITPRWFPDGRAIAFLKRTKGGDRVWRTDIAGARSAPVTPEGLDVADFRIIDNARIVVRFVTLPPAVTTEFDAESRTGYHYDERFVPMRASVPILGKTEAHFAVFDSATGRQSEAGKSDIALFDARVGSVSTGEPCTPFRSPAGQGFIAPTRIELRCGGASPLLCDATACQDSYGPLWLSGKRVRFIRREGWAHMTTAIYEWWPGTAHVRRLYSTGDALIDCQPRQTQDLICLRETSLRPRYLVAIDLARGRVREIADPNPEFAQLTLGAVERIKLTSSLGIPAYVDTVLPTDYQPGQRYPLIVVQYQSRGFLRGGVGDEFPIQLFANNGFAVLSLQRPAPAGAVADATDPIDIDRRNLIGFADRRNVLSVIDKGIDALIARGVVEPSAIGITGLSDGSSTVQYAAVNSSRFSAGILSGCCWEPQQSGWVGPAYTARFAAIGWPGVSTEVPAFWRQMSLIQNAHRVHMPLLFEAADDELRAAVDSVTALREAGKPADLFVFPGEFHLKWQPAHRLAAYQRGLDWFMFWLRDKRPEDPRREAEVKRWAAMKSGATR